MNPAFVQLAAGFEITPVQASYELAVYVSVSQFSLRSAGGFPPVRGSADSLAAQILFAGVGPLLIVPFATVYGRRPIYLCGNLLAAVCNLVAAHCSTWTGIMWVVPCYSRHAFHSADK